MAQKSIVIHTHTHKDTSSVHLLFLLSTPVWARWLGFFVVWLWDFVFACFLFGWLVGCFGLFFLQCKCINHAAELIRVQATDHISAGTGKIKLETRPKGRRERQDCFFTWSCWLILITNEYLSFLLLSAVEGFVDLINNNLTTCKTIRIDNSL